ncbi:MAG: NAD(+) diphosphatase [Acidobacteria bacterium]|nr:MAG: NAD(+) diphosphatase [Acidobacteriota bacterium]
MRSPNPLAPDHTDPRTLDRRHLVRRDAGESARLERHAEALFTVVWRERSLVTEEADALVRPALLDATGVAELLDENARPTLVLLGFDEGRPHFAFDLSLLDDPDSHPLIASAGTFCDLRQVAARLDARAANLLAYARAMTTWHRRHRFCGACGAPTESRDAGHLRVCSDPSCGLQGFPRTDAAVIMLVHDGGERCLLGRQASWPPGVFSTLAGFVEPGENLEHAVAREVFEEVGVRIGEVEYHSSQPWPFPSSIMLGFWAEAISDEITVDETEIEQAHWFHRDELLERTARRELHLPPRMSISRRLVDDWLREA